MLQLHFKNWLNRLLFLLSVAHSASELKISGAITFRPSIKVSTVSFMTDGKDSRCVYCTYSVLYCTHGFEPHVTEGLQSFYLWTNIPKMLGYSM
jgi:hypothetical protein